MIEDFLEPLVCEKIVNEMSAIQGRSSVVYGSSQAGVVNETTRKSLRLTPSAETVELVVGRLLACRDEVAAHFGVEIGECEDPQFLRYQTGDFFVAHQDGNTGLLRLDTERRLVSTVIFLSRESDSPEEGVYCGGSLVFTNLRAPAKFHLRATPGTLIAFRSETTHEVTPVTHGQRLSIVSWYRS
ncbi:MAG TPA: 2OG-Fe(II) oxygenase [Pyrinomonadaceae bacterium]|nr:2OG-Fe(II) oxygenase [Pyrinomonadaceae bacterium]